MRCVMRASVSSRVGPASVGGTVLERPACTWTSIASRLSRSMADSHTISLPVCADVPRSASDFHIVKSRRMQDGVITEVITSVDQLRQYVGKQLRVGEWHAVTQEQIDQFADATGDHQ